MSVLAAESLWDGLEGSKISIRFVVEGSSTAAIDAVPGRTSVDGEYATSARQAFETRDYIVKQSELDAESIAIPPRGAKIQELDSEGSVTATYRVANAGGDRHWDPVDQFGVLIRIHAVT